MIRTEDPAHPVHLNPLLKLALEMGPLVIFFFVNQRGDIFVATAVFYRGHGDRARHPLRAGAQTAGDAAGLGGRRRRLRRADAAFCRTSSSSSSKTHHREHPVRDRAAGRAVFRQAASDGGARFRSFFKLTDEGWHKLTFPLGAVLLFSSPQSTKWSGAHRRRISG